MYCRITGQSVDCGHHRTSPVEFKHKLRCLIIQYKLFFCILYVESLEPYTIFLYDASPLRCIGNYEYTWVYTAYFLPGDADNRDFLRT